MSFPSPLPDADTRNQVIARVQTAYADQIISLPEMKERVETALTAASAETLLAAVAGLPEPSAPRTLDIVAQSGKIRRQGAWSVPRFIHIDTSYGKVTLDFTEAIFEENKVDLEIQTRFARVTLIVPANAIINTDELYSGWKQPKIDEKKPDAAPGGPVINVSGFMEYKRLRIKRKCR